MTLTGSQNMSGSFQGADPSQSFSGGFASLRPSATFLQPVGLRKPSYFPNRDEVSVTSARAHAFLNRASTNAASSVLL